MRKLILTVVLVSCFLLIAGPSLVFSQDLGTKSLSAKSSADYAPGEIVVKFRPGIRGQVINGLLYKHRASVISTSLNGGFKRLKIPAGKTVPEMVAAYRHNPNVEYAEPNYIAHAFETPKDPLYGYQWHLKQINTEAARDITTGDPDVIVAVVDTGVAYEDYQDGGVQIGKSGKYTAGTVYLQAPDLAGTDFVAGYDFVNDDEHPNDDEGHGTHVTGTIAQTTNNSIGTAGVAPQVSIMPVKVLDSTGSGTYTAIADGIYFAANNGADVINLSLGGAAGSDTLKNALAYANAKDVTIVCASGNDGYDTSISFPAAYDAYCIAVGATRYDGTRSYYSNGGDSLDLVAPGGDTTVDQNGDSYGDGVLQQTFGSGGPTDFGYFFYQGTSMATPHVAGVAALLISQSIAVTPDAVREVLQSTAVDKGAAGWDAEYGWGLIDAAEALNYMAEPNTQPVADVGGPYTGTEDEPVSFDGSGSTDANSDSLTYAWTFGDGESGAGMTVSHTYAAGGTYTVTLTVNDGKVDSEQVLTTVEIAEVNDAPIAEAGPDQVAVTGDSVSFNGVASYDPDGDTLTYLWDFGDGETGNGAEVSHSYATAGEYSVTLTVSDGELSGTDTTTVTVSDVVSQSLALGNISMSIKVAGLNVNALATIAIVDQNGLPVEGATVYGQWSGLTSDADAGVTDVSGLVYFSSDKLKNPSGTFTLTVTSGIKDGWEDYAGGESVSISH